MLEKMLQPRDGHLFNAYDMSDDGHSVPLDLQNFSMFNIQFFWTGGTGTFDGQIKVQMCQLPSDTDGDWYDVPNLLINIQAASGMDMIELTQATAKYYRFLYTKNNITGGTLNAYLGAKRA